MSGNLSGTEPGRGTGGLFGFLVDSNTGPIQSSRQVAKYGTAGSGCPESWVDDEDSLTTELVRTDCDRDSNYAHAGWSLPPTSTQSPWVLSRISNQSQARVEGSWITKRMLIKKRTVNIPPEDLRAAPEFEADIRDALSKDSKTERFQEVYKVFGRWGDVIPLVFDLGASLTITDTEKRTEPVEAWWLNQSLLTSRTGKISTKGGKLQAMSGGNITTWVSQDLQTRDWRIVQVSKVMPTINLLNAELQAQLAGLHATRTISKVIVRCGSRVDGLSAVFTDDNQSNQRGLWSNENIFELSNGEYISDVIVWGDANGVHAVQFVTTLSRFSPHYGGNDGTPIILSSEGGILAEFAKITRDNEMNTISRIQTIWRHDIPQTPCIPGGRYTEYIGGPGGRPFNDWAFSGPSHSAYISGVNIQCENNICGIQMAYTKQADGRTIISQAPYHGRPVGEKYRFDLAQDEHIVAVSGVRSGVIVGLRFMTNTGRTSNAFGGNEGSGFVCKPRALDGRSMRLAFIAGKCDCLLDGLLLVWVPI